MTIMDGKALAAKLKTELAEKVQKLPRKPGLAVILVGENPASQTYVAGKRRDCEQCGFYSEGYTLPATTGQAELLELVDELNTREDIDGILCQLPLPKPLAERPILDAIAPDKDVDGLGPVNLGKLLIGDRSGFVCCTPLGVMKLLEEYGIDPTGKDCVMVGRSNIVGKPLAALLTQHHGTVTICHTKTQNLPEKCAQADILLSAVGKQGLITPDMVKPGAVVIDIAINRDEGGKLHGDVTPEALEKASFATPVPGGVGPMTRAALMLNTYQSACRHLGVKA